VDKHYERYCVADPHFYDSLSSAQPEATWFAAARRPVPDGWQREARNDWLVYGPPGGRPSEQGWKIHVSACLDNADRILDDVFRYCRDRGVAFKFIRGRAALLMRNAKYASRGTSGKFITVYPRDEAELEIVCRELGALIDGEPGPHILSDLRLGNGPLHVRYGRTRVPDRREPVFDTPSGVSLPAFLGPHLAARNANTVVHLPYRIDEAIHFSNAGGLYAAVDTRTGERVVLKEARPHAGLDADGVDAITRLGREQAALERLSDLAAVPRVHDRFPLGEHQVLALEYIDAEPLNKLLVERYPMTDANAGPDEYREYSRWALHIDRQIERTVAAIHQRGLVHGDLHPFNVLVRTGGPDADTAVLIDFEVAGPVDGYRRPGLRSQGFAAPPGVTGTDIDRYALACLRLAMFLPLTAMLRLAPEKAADFAAVIAENFQLPETFLSEAVATITAAAGSAPANRPRRFAPPARPARTPPDTSGPATLRRLADVIVDSATPGRDDRLFPGDIEQFHSGGLNLAYGAAGVLYALHATGAGRYPDFEDWLVARALRPRSGSRLGFYDGLHGVAYTLHELGRGQEALDVLDRCLTQNADELGPDLMSGLAGIGLNLLHLADATGEPALRDAADRVTDLICDRLAAVVDADPPTGADAISGGRHPRAGLTRGWTGPALLFLRTYERTGDTGMLDLAVTAIGQDLYRCTVRPDGSVEVDEGWRTVPHLADGSTGIGIVIDQIRQYRPDPGLTVVSDAISLAARTPFHAQSGLFAGRAGIIRYLAGHDRDADRAAAQIRNLAWHAVPYRGGIAFPGDQLLRLSMDLATGSAGVLLALAAALHHPGADLPFLAPPGP
jgi:serine/threonine protein kinase